jgi:alkanesulfonate monooxygenase SsuD/methylene tetrahydromethanopterin reductase-like flavin-dependent oxidoreductase (luciferase family)
VGRRSDDYAACHVDYARRGRILDDQLESGVPSLSDVLGSRLLFGGQSPATIGRAVRHGGGWVASAGLGAWQNTATLADGVRAAWTAAGRPGAPRLVAMIYIATGPRADEDAREHMHSYYGFLGPQRADVLTREVITSPGRLVETRDRIAEAGFDELLLLPTSADPGQLDALRTALS